MASVNLTIEVRARRLWLVTPLIRLASYPPLVWSPPLALAVVNGALRFLRLEVRQGRRWRVVDGPDLRVTWTDADGR